MSSNSGGAESDLIDLTKDDDDFGGPLSNAKQSKPSFRGGVSHEISRGHDWGSDYIGNDNSKPLCSNGDIVVGTGNTKSARIDTAIVSKREKRYDNFNEQYDKAVAEYNKDNSFSNLRSRNSQVYGWLYRTQSDLGHYESFRNNGGTMQEFDATQAGSKGLTSDNAEKVGWLIDAFKKRENLQQEGSKQSLPAPSLFPPPQWTVWQRIVLL